MVPAHTKHLSSAYLLPTGHSAANPLAAATVVDRWGRQMDRHLQSCILFSAASKTFETEWQQTTYVKTHMLSSAGSCGKVPVNSSNVFKKTIQKTVTAGIAIMTHYITFEWKETVESKGMRVNMNKTKVMISGDGVAEGC